jgi:NitT/TauT family transport system permease protein
MSAPAATAAERRAPERPGRRPARPGRARLGLVLPPILFGIGLLLLWEAFVTVAGIKPYLLPKPSAIAAQVASNVDDIVEAAKATGANALVGLLVGSVLALAAAIVAARSRLADGLLAPVAAAMNAVPIIALAPLFNTMFSSTSTVPRRMVVAVVVFPPLFVNTVRGLRQVTPVHRELLESYAASPWALTRTVRLPGALPFVFTGFRLASSLAVIAAVVAEYFGGLQDGLGSRITSAASNSAYPRAWAFVVAACVLGLACYVVMLAVERAAMPWRARR